MTIADLVHGPCTCPMCNRPAEAYQVKADGPNAVRYILCRWRDCQCGRYAVTQERMVELINEDRERSGK